MNRAPARYQIKRSPLYRSQAEAIFSEARISLIEASTKSGKTHGCLVWLAELALICGAPGRVFWWVAPVYGQARMAFRRMKRALPRGGFRQNEAEMSLTLLNEALIFFKSAEKPDHLFGEDVFGLVVDEASRVREESWHAMRSTVSATGGPIRAIGNVKGRRNWFYALCREAQKGGDPELDYHRMTWRDAVAAGIMPESEIESARKHLPPRAFEELYEAKPGEDEGNPFGGWASISQCIIPELSTRPPLVWGWDLAKSHDFTVGIALDEMGEVCRFLRFRKPWEETIKTIAETVGSTSALIDSTGVGDPIVERLQRDHGSNFEGYQFTSPSKQRLMEGLAVAIQSREVLFPEGPISSELDEFTYEVNRTGVRYTAPPGFHDDCVIALSLAVSQAISGKQALTPGSIVIDERRRDEIGEVLGI